MPKYKSRATRASDITADWGSAINGLEDLVMEAKDGEKLTTEEIAEQAEGIIATIDVSAVEELAQEMGDWRDNMEGTNLESTEKYERVSEAADTLENIQLDVSLSSVKEGEVRDREELLNEIEQIVSEIETAKDELESVEFPGMYG